MSRHEKAKSGSFLDTWFRGPKKSASVSRSTGQHVPRPTSDSDFPDDDSEALISQMDDGELNNKFEEMLNDMNLTDEKKEPLRQLSISKKKNMLIMHCKGSSQEGRSKLDKPMDYINYLSQPELSMNKQYACLESLRIALTNNTLSWVHEFGTTGLKLLFSTLEKCCRGDGKYEKLQYESLRCFKVFMNNTEGLKQVLDQNEGMLVIAHCLDPLRPTVMIEALKIMAALCLIEDNKGRSVGHEKILNAITIAGEKRSQERFKPVIEGLKKQNPAMWSSCLQFINAVIMRADDFDYRMHLRNEIVRTGLIDQLDNLRASKIDHVEVQIQIFDNNREDDSEELIQRFDNVRMELDDLNDCFEVLKNTTLDTQAEPYFLSILQHLLFIRDDHQVKPAYYKLIEECVTQIVLHKNGLDPDFRANRRFLIDVQPLIDGLKEASRAEDEKKIEDLTQRLDEVLVQKQEALAKLSVLEARLAQGGGAGPAEGALSPQNKANIAKVLGGPPPPPMPGAPPAPPMPGMGGPPPPPMPGMGPPPPPMPGMGGPPPPPMPGMGGPPPPPMPGMGGPPPPPPFGMGPPPPPGMMAPIQRVDVLPHGLKPKKKWDVSGPLKKANWKTIIPQRMSEKSFWVKCQEDRMASPDILNGLAERFSSKPPTKKMNDDVDNKSSHVGTMKKVKELKVLDGKSAQNISILLGGSLKHMPYSKVKSCLLRCDDTVLNGSVLEQLIQYLPPPDQMNKLSQFKESYNELTEAEQFCVTLSEVKRLLPRLKSLSFRQHYAEMVSDVKPDIVAGTAACDEVKDSNKFAKVLELILLLGNYMNTGSRNGGAFGFEISFLTKLTGTKDLENKQTLLHYLVETIERKFPELLNFYDELSHIDKASRTSLDNIQKTLRQMDSSIKNLETDLTNSKVPQSEEDKFAEVMGSFAIEAREQCTLLQGMFKHMEALYSEISEYFSFDKAKYNLEEFFTDLKTFKDSFVEAHKDNVKEREALEKQRRTKEAREKAEKERQERAARKRLVDMNPEKTQEGVMDSLLEALQTGSAFSREQKRRRGPRVAGAERRAQLARSRSRTGLIGPGLTGRELSSEILSSA